jgi:hypothetical protein
MRCEIAAAEYIYLRSLQDVTQSIVKVKGVRKWYTLI